MLSTLEKKDEKILTRGNLSSLVLGRFEVIDEKLNRIFEDEINRRNSIFLRVENRIISKIAMFIAGAMKRPAAIGIAGETASGKSTVAYDIISCTSEFEKEHSLNNVIARINTDDYYYDRSEMVKKYGSFSEFAKNYDLDSPEALELTLMNNHIQELLNGNSVYLPKYDMRGTAIRFDNQTLTMPSKIIISEGLFTLTKQIHSVFDLKIYVDIPVEVQAQRFFTRAKERNLGESADFMFKNASDKAQTYIRPCKSKSDIVLSGSADREQYKRFLYEILALIEEVHFKNAVSL